MSATTYECTTCGESKSDRDFVFLGIRRRTTCRQCENSKHRARQARKRLAVKVSLNGGETRRCRDCGQEKSAGDFYLIGGAALSFGCISCNPRSGFFAKADQKKRFAPAAFQRTAKNRVVYAPEGACIDLYHWFIFRRSIPSAQEQGVKPCKII